MFTTPSDWIALALALLGGLLLGLALAPGGRKWRTRYSTERDAHAVYRRDSESRLTRSEARIRELEAERTRLAGSDTRLSELERERESDRAELARAREAASTSQARVAELERENARLSQAPAYAPAATSRVTPAAPVMSPAAAPATASTQPIGAGRPKRGWFDFGPGSDPRVTRLR